MKSNIFKSIITTILGVATVIVTLILIFVGTIGFIWEGIAGLVIGTLLIISPDTIVTNTGVFIGRFTKKGNDEPNSPNP